MRPAGAVRQALADALKPGPGTSRQVAQRACAGLEATRRTLDNMVRAGHARVLRQERVPGVRRPVPVYALAEPEPASAWPLLVQCWAAGDLPLQLAA